MILYFIIVKDRIQIIDLNVKLVGVRVHGSEPKLMTLIESRTTGYSRICTSLPVSQLCYNIMLSNQIHCF